MAAALLETKNVDVAYQAKQVVFKASLEVQEGEFVSLIGHNGAGKTTLLKTICGFLPLLGGDILYNGRSIARRSTEENVRDGIVFVHQEKSLFPNLTVLENLKIAAYALDLQAELEQRLATVYSLFPILKERGHQLAKTLSGGQQKQVAIGMAILVRPKVLLLDEPTLGLSPNLVHELGRVLREIKEMGTSILLVEQNVGMAINLAERVFVMKTGQIILAASKQEMLARDDLWDLF
ncbi:MAG: ABC transporter ATP-binding protein [Thermodesulfobacteriota bacterium]